MWCRKRYFHSFGGKGLVGQQRFDPLWDPGMLGFPEFSTLLSSRAAVNLYVRKLQYCLYYYMYLFHHVEYLAHCPGNLVAPKHAFMTTSS